MARRAPLLSFLFTSIGLWLIWVWSSLAPPPLTPMTPHPPTMRAAAAPSPFGTGTLAPTSAAPLPSPTTDWFAPWVEPTTPRPTINLFEGLGGPAAGGGTLGPDAVAAAMAAANKMDHITSNSPPEPEPTEAVERIDFVYTWVNGTDDFFQKLLRTFQPPDQSVMPHKYREWDELRYSLRSVFRYCRNWVNTIWIGMKLSVFLNYTRCLYFALSVYPSVTQHGQVPSWLSPWQTQVRVVNFHTLLTPAEQTAYLPTFNSNVIGAFALAILFQGYVWNDNFYGV
jgi:hypothetical protein